jgi:hypothetical protein
MHRSGTSLVSRVLNVLGVDLGPEEHLMRPSTDNPTGQWESRPIKEINDEILSILGGSWQEPPPLPAGWERSPQLAGPRRRAREVIEGDFSGSELWGFKDPRNSLTLPFWQRILDPMRYVICLRNPLDVAASAGARNRADDTVPFEQGVELWLTYVRGALAATAGHPRQLVFYEDLMTDPEPVVRELARFIGLDQSSDAESDVRTAIGIAVTGGLWHHRTAVPNVVDASRLPFHVKAYYLNLRQFVQGTETVGPEALDLLGAYAAAAGDQQAQLNTAVAELKQAREHARTLKRRAVALEQRVAERSEELDRATAERDEARRRREAERRRLIGERDEERRLRRRLESELEDSRKEVSRLQASTEPGGSDAAPSPTAPARPGYENLASEVRERAAEVIPSGATVLVAGKGDEALLRFDDRTGWHFPMAEDGRYAGFHPGGDTAAIAQLEALRARGADHLLLPKTTLWWLDHYEGLRRHLEDRYTALLTDERCAIYRLTGEESAGVSGLISTLNKTISCLRIRTGRDPSILDWDSGLGIADHLPYETVFAPPNNEPTLPYLDDTVDIVMVPADAATSRLVEARRVAASAVITVDPGSSERAELEWLAGGHSGWGEDASVTMIPDGDGGHWDATLDAFAEALQDGFAGEFGAVGDPATLGQVCERAAATGVSLRQVEAPATGVARQARAAAESSDRRLQIFLTAPAVPLPGWLPSILALFGRERDAGVVGARIVSRFGFLEEAGGILAADGTHERRGAGDANPDRPEYCFVRRVDFCSPPVVATRRDLFERLNGIDQGVKAPDDPLVDFSLRAGQAGAPVYYQPQARVVAMGDKSR